MPIPPTRTQIIGTCYTSDGDPVSDGSLEITLAFDTVISGGPQLVSGKTIVFALDSNGNIAGTRYLWATALMSPQSPTPYYNVTLKSSGGQTLWSQQCQVTAGATFDLANWIPTV